MIDTIYIEESIAGHPRTKEILLRFPQATPISCSNYKEIFNPSGQNFRLQKKKPSLILAEKTGHLALPIPETYGIGGKRNFYFSLYLFLLRVFPNYLMEISKRGQLPIFLIGNGLVTIILKAPRY